MVNFKELLGNDNQLQNLLLDTVEEGEVIAFVLQKKKVLFLRIKEMKGERSSLLLWVKIKKEIALFIEGF